MIHVDIEAVNEGGLFAVVSLILYWIARLCLQI